MESDPRRKRRGGDEATSTIADSIPKPVGPPSRMSSTCLPRLAATCAAVVGETPFDRLALGAAIGSAVRSMSARAAACMGTRTATVVPPAVTSGATAPSRSGKTSVSGPGQNSAASARATADTCAARSNARLPEASCTIDGFVAGRPFAR